VHQNPGRSGDKESQGVYGGCPRSMNRGINICRYCLKNIRLAYAFEEKGKKFRYIACNCKYTREYIELKDDTQDCKHYDPYLNRIKTSNLLAFVRMAIIKNIIRHNHNPINRAWAKAEMKTPVISVNEGKSL